MRPSRAAHTRQSQQQAVPPGLGQGTDTTRSSWMAWLGRTRAHAAPLPYTHRHRSIEIRSKSIESPCLAEPARRTKVGRRRRQQMDGANVFSHYFGTAAAGFDPNVPLCFASPKPLGYPPRHTAVTTLLLLIDPIPIDWTRPFSPFPFQPFVVSNHHPSPPPSTPDGWNGIYYLVVGPSWPGATLPPHKHAHTNSTNSSSNNKTRGTAAVWRHHRRAATGRRRRPWGCLWLPRSKRRWRRAPTARTAA